MPCLWQHSVALSIKVSCLTLKTRVWRKRSWNATSTNIYCIFLASQCVLPLNCILNFIINYVARFNLIGSGKISKIIFSGKRGKLGHCVWRRSKKLFVIRVLIWAFYVITIVVILNLTAEFLTVCSAVVSGWVNWWVGISITSDVSY